MNQSPRHTKAEKTQCIYRGLCAGVAESAIPSHHTKAWNTLFPWGCALGWLNQPSPAHNRVENIDTPMGYVLGWHGKFPRGYLTAVLGNPPPPLEMPCKIQVNTPNTGHKETAHHHRDDGEKHYGAQTHPGHGPEDSAQRCC